MSELARIIGLERAFAALGIAFACMAQAHRQAREAAEYMAGMAEAVEVCRRTARAVGDEVEL